MYIVYKMNRQGIGVEFVGPFDTQDQADAYGVRHWGMLEDYTFEVVSLSSPSVID